MSRGGPTVLNHAQGRPRTSPRGPRLATDLASRCSLSLSLARSPADAPVLKQNLDGARVSLSRLSSSRHHKAKPKKCSSLQHWGNVWSPPPPPLLIRPVPRQYGVAGKWPLVVLTALSIIPYALSRMLSLMKDGFFIRLISGR